MTVIDKKDARFPAQLSGQSWGICAGCGKYSSPLFNIRGFFGPRCWTCYDDLCEALIEQARDEAETNLPPRGLQRGGENVSTDTDHSRSR